MKFFKKKPKADVMGFICCETSLKRSYDMVNRFHDEKLFYLSYLYSTAMIFHDLEKKYSLELIAKIENYCDKFFLKKNKQFRSYEIKKDRSMVMDSIKNEKYIEDFLEKSELKDETGEIQNILDEWNSAGLFLNDDIKSM